ncbi:MAG: hypothetical protein ACJ70Z_03335 [Nitrososphaera sp.]
MVTKRNEVFFIEPVVSKDGHKRTSSHYLTFVNPQPLALRATNIM